MLDDWFKRAFGDEEPETLGSGWWSGVLAVFLGLLGLGAVLCLHFPELLTFVELRAAYPMTLIRGLIQGVIIAAFVSGLLSALLRRRRTMAVTGISLAVAATVLGGAKVPIEGSVAGDVYLGLDWFLLNLLLFAVVFVPLERLFPHRADQSTFRPGWTTDLVHFLVSHVGVQVVALLTVAPATFALGWAVNPRVQAAVSGQPVWAQVLEIIVLADLTEYAVHRAFHAVPLLWRFHAIHHSSQAMDWLAASRVHIVDITVTRSLSFVPVFLLGFDVVALYAYLAFVSGHAVLIHANVRWRLRWLDPFVVTPRFHHWHHSAEPEAIDKNFAVHMPWLDRLFGTHHLPADRWPARYGIDEAAPRGGYVDHLLHPLRRRRGPTPRVAATDPTRR